MARKENQSIETDPKMSEIIKLANKDLKVVKIANKDLIIVKIVTVNVNCMLRNVKENKEMHGYDEVRN